VQANETMTTKILKDKVLEVISFLIGLYILQTILPFILPLVINSNYELGMALVRNSGWIGNIIFGLAIFFLMKSKGLIAVSVGILSIVLPIYGPIFYILTELQKERAK
jgi:isocitrate dehydrogenase kinase/phosphatase